MVMGSTFTSKSKEIWPFSDNLLLGWSMGKFSKRTQLCCKHMPYNNFCRNKTKGKEFLAPSKDSTKVILLNNSPLNFISKAKVKVNLKFTDFSSNKIDKIKNGCPLRPRTRLLIKFNPTWCTNTISICAIGLSTNKLKLLKLSSAFSLLNKFRVRGLKFSKISN